jgi:hypothetical protein
MGHILNSMRRMLKAAKAGTNVFGRITLFVTGLFVTGMIAVWPTIVLAAGAPTPSLKKSPGAWLGILVMFLLLVAVLGVSLLPSKRSHQD